MKSTNKQQKKNTQKVSNSIFLTWSNRIEKDSEKNSEKDNSEKKLPTDFLSMINNNPNVEYYDSDEDKNKKIINNKQFKKVRLNGRERYKRICYRNNKIYDINDKYDSEIDELSDKDFWITDED
jgi:hypothetical protein